MSTNHDAEKNNALLAPGAIPQNDNAVLHRTSPLALAAVLAAGGMFIGASYLFQPQGASAGMSEEESGSDAFAHLPEKRALQAIIRDFRGADEANGHADFQSFSGDTTVGLVEPMLDADGRPVAADLRGQKIVTNYTDADGRPINPALYDATFGDTIGVLETGPSSNGLTSAVSFSQWYRDIPGINASTQVDLVLTREPGTDRYVFDSDIDTPYAARGGFFPIDGALYGDYHQLRDGEAHNYHFTTHIATEFTHTPADEQVFSFTGDDDVWVFVDGRLVLDLGGLHSKREQTVDISRLDWLVAGENYRLDIFHAERRFRDSNFRIETTLRLRKSDLPPSSGLHD
ncbi:MAG: hypothetical protein DHS20C14_04660 [Phycisphaeraceae bacterium]|nr:MAG: hypothetical protein DHS20C14_04660 [Phycisphaeraceae bacterium]